eukprot:scaffold10295_cov116-Isochrysis_galbana.AAC.6
MSACTHSQQMYSRGSVASMAHSVGCNKQRSAAAAESVDTGNLARSTTQRAAATVYSSSCIRWERRVSSCVATGSASCQP